MNIKIKLYFYVILISLSTLSFAIDTKGDYVNDDIDTFSKNVIEASSDITLTLESHSNGSLVGDIVPIIVTVESVYELASLTAQIDDSVITLVYNEDAGPAFVGELNLTGLPSGDYTMVISATDSTAQTAQISVTVTLDRAPTLTVTSPINLSVARPTIPLNLSCSDDSGSCTIVVLIPSGSPYIPDRVLASGTDTLEQDLDLAFLGYTMVNLMIRASDSSQQTAMDSRSIYVETSKFIESIFEAPAEVLDFTDNIALHGKIDSNDLVISDLTKTDQTTINLPVDYKFPYDAYLTANGAIFTAPNRVTYRTDLFDFNDGNLYDLGLASSYTSLVTEGNYAIWSNAETLTLRDLSNKTNRIVSTDAANTKNDVAESGLVVYWDNTYSVVLDSDGSQSTIASDVNLWNTYPVTDGDSVVYRKHDACCQDQNYSLYVYRAGSNTLLSNLGLNEPGQGRDYQINNGWIAYTDIGSSGQKQVWTLDPSNVRVKRNAFGTESTIVHLASNGELIFTFSGEYYLSKPDGTFIQLGGLSYGQVGYDADGWHITIGREIFRIQSLALDSDGDGILDPNDNCINEPNFDQTDTDADQIGDACDPDDDGDGVVDGSDAFPLDATETIDTDSDGIGNNADTDDDGDGVLDAVDLYPLDASRTNEQLLDIDGNGKVDALTDGLVILRYVLGLRGDILIGGVVASDATRTTAEEIEAYLETLIPAL